MGEKIICILIAKNNKPLVGYSEDEDLNNCSICENLLQQIVKKDSGNIEVPNYLFYYINETDITYTLLATKQFSIETILGCLDDVKQLFESKFSNNNFEKVDKYELNSQFKDNLKSKYEFYNKNPDCPNEDLYNLRMEIEQMNMDISKTINKKKNEEIKISDLEKQIKDLNNELKKEKDKNMKLERELSSLKEKLNLDFEKNKSLELQKGELLKELNDLKNKSNSNGEFSLYKKLYDKEEEIKKLNLKLKKYPFELLDGENIMSIIFLIAQKDNYSIICKNTDLFINVENKLYDKYPDLRNNENYFLLGGNKINKFKSLDENKIKDNDLITLEVFE